MSNKQLRADLQTALQNLATGVLRTSATALLGKLGYLLHLKDKPGADARIDWNTIRPQQVRAVNHDQLAGLQMADAVASSLFFAVNLTQYSEVEDRYFRMLRILAIKRAKKCRPQVRVSHPFGLPVLPLASTNLALACTVDASQ